MEIVVDHITVSKKGMVLEVLCTPQGAKVSDAQARKAVELFPNISRHVCINDKGETFGEEIVGTEPAHLLEHIVIELMAQVHGSGNGLMGHTSFMEERGRMAVKLTFIDDLVALDCIKRAVSVINAL